MWHRLGAEQHGTLLMQGDTMARPPKYTSDDEKPVSVTFRLPRQLYDQAQQHAKQRRATLTELVCEGLQMRLETPTDPRDILATQDITVMQELEQMIDARVHAILAAESNHAPVAAPQRTPTGKSKTVHYGNAPKGQLDPNTCPPYDEAKSHLGKLCPRRHEWGTTGQTLLRRSNHRCRTCENEGRKEKRAARTPK